jgi:outer membrane protein OmpA-like peptidoglycan-associated protein
MKKTNGVSLLLITLLFFASASIFQNSALRAQNLVPNPGFEEHQEDSVSYWKQPGNSYYHFECNPKWAHRGNCYNGLCDWGTEPTEYLEVKLRSTLVKDKKYRVKAFSRIQSADTVEIIKDSAQFMGMRFDENRTDVYLKTCIMQKPDIVLYVFRDTLWHKTEFDYIASGKENYLIIGHFFDSIDMPILRMDTNFKKYLAQKEILLSDKNEKKKTEISKITKKYKRNLAAFYEMGKVKSPRKLDKLLSDYTRALTAQKMEISRKTSEINDEYKSKINELAKKYNIDPQRLHFTNFYRLYFDDISVELAPDITSETEKIIPLNNVFFNTAEWILLPASFIELNIHVAYLKEKPNLKVEISGHTDIIGSDTDNKLLSENRAKAVMDYFIQKGISPDRLSYKGYGRSKPIANNQTEEGRAKNRRVEMKIISE